MAVQAIKLNLIPGSVLPVVNVSQYDVKRIFGLSVYEGTEPYSLSGKTVEIRGTKPDMHGFDYDTSDGVISVNGNTVTVYTTKQMTAVGGRVVAELRISQGSTVIGTINFIIAVEPSALSDDTIISDTDIPVIEREFEEALTEAQGYATQAGASASSASSSASSASSSASSASSSASSASTNALKSEGYAVGKQNGTDVGSGSPYYHNNSKYYSDLASSWSAHPPYIGANGNWYIWNTNTNQYTDSGIDASITVTVGSTTTLPEGSNASVTNSGSDTDPILNFGIPKGDTGAAGRGITSIAKTGTSGLVDTYTITYSDGTTSTFTVTNGSGQVVNHGIVL